MSTALAKALARFERMFIPEPNSGCWLWTATLNTNGYASFWFKRLMGGHRFAYEAYRGAIPQGMTIDHLCHVRSCVNPFHLEVVTHQTNCQRRIRRIMTHCPHGHKYTRENTYISKTGYQCRTCTRLRMRRIRANRRST